MPLSFHDRNPAAAQEVEAAYADALHGGIEGELGGVSLQDVIAGDVDQNKPAESDYNKDLSVIRDPEYRAAIGDALTSAKELFGAADIYVPSGQEFEDRGVDFAQLAEIYEEMETRGLEPAVVAAPFLFDPADWSRIYKDIGRLEISPDTVEHWPEIARPMNFDIPTPMTPRRSNKSYEEGSLEWTLRILPGASKAPQSVEFMEQTELVGYPTVNEYLTFQAMRIQAGKDPADSSPDGNTLLHGKIYESGNSHERLPFGYWHRQRNAITIQSTDAFIAIRSCGLRPPRHAGTETVSF